MCLWQQNATLSELSIIIGRLYETILPVIFWIVNHIQLGISTERYLDYGKVALKIICLI